MSAAVRVEAGYYEIGSDDIPNAGPRHRRLLASDFWIDEHPVTWAHYEAFVAAGGYGRDELWPAAGGGDPARLPSPANARPASVDDRCRALLEPVWSAAAATTPGRDRRAAPLCGATWFEAVTIARFFGARLAFEEEWEVAIGSAGSPAKQARPRLPAAPAGGAAAATLEEWTASAFTTCYWRAEADQRTPAWSPGQSASGVSVRGSSPDSLYRHPAARRDQDPQSGQRFLSFRRVWDRPPTEFELGAMWR